MENLISKPVGRPTDYKSEYSSQVYKLCLLGATDIEIADFFGVCEATVNNWKNNFPEFLESIKQGKIKADMEIANSLFERAKGCEVLTQKAFKVKKGKDLEEVEIANVTEAYPPDPIAIKFWLTNRNMHRWKDKQEVEQTNTSNVTMTFTEDGLKQAASKITDLMDSIRNDRKA